MRFLQLLLFFSLIASRIWKQDSEPSTNKTSRMLLKDNGAKWADSLLNKLPKNIDTTIYKRQNEIS